MANALRHDDATRLAQQLVWAILTPYQADQLLGGRTSELVIGPFRLSTCSRGRHGQVFKAVHDPPGAGGGPGHSSGLRGPASGDRAPLQREGRAAACFRLRMSSRSTTPTWRRPPLPRHGFAAGIDLAELVRQVRAAAMAHACDYIRTRPRLAAYSRAQPDPPGHQAVQPAHYQPPDAVPAEKPAAAPAANPANEETIVRRHVPAEVPHCRRSVALEDPGPRPGARLDRLGSRSVDGSMTEEGLLMGTPDYIAPEQAETPQRRYPRRPLQPRLHVLFRILTRQSAFPRRRLVEKLLAHRLDVPAVVRLRPDVPTGVLMILEKLMAKRPEERYQSSGGGGGGAGHRLRSGRTPASGSPSRRPPPRGHAVHFESGRERVARGGLGGVGLAGAARRRKSRCSKHTGGGSPPCRSRRCASPGLWRRGRNPIRVGGQRSATP